MYIKINNEITVSLKCNLKHFKDYEVITYHVDCSICGISPGSEDIQTTLKYLRRHEIDHDYPLSISNIDFTITEG